MSTESAPLLRIMIVDDHPFFRRGLREVLDGEPDMCIVAEAADGEEAIQAVRRLRPDELDLVLMDIDLPKMSGLDAAMQINQFDPELSIVMVTVSTLDRDLFEALEGGAVGFLSKGLAPEAIVAALRAFHRDGALPLSKTMAQRLLGYFRSHPPEREAPALGGLSEREQEVLELIGGGARDREIAEKLVISESTVKKHVQNILRKLQARNRTEAVRHLHLEA